MNPEGDAADRLAQAIHQPVTEAVQAALERDRPAPPPEKPAPRGLYGVAKSRQQLGGISRTMLYELDNAGE